MADEMSGAGPGLHTGEESGGARGKAQELTHAARESGRDLLDQAVEKKDELKARASTAVDDGRMQLADRASSLSRALHRTAENLETEGDRQLGHWVHQAADQVDRVVGYLNGHDAQTFMTDMEGMARRNPALFLGGTYAAGLVLGRFLRASSPERRMEHELEREREDTYRTSGTPEAELGWPGSSGYAETGVGGMGGNTPWTGVGVSRDSFAGGYSAGGSGDFGAPSGSVPLSGSEEDAGLTDEDLREAWHDRGADEDREGMRGSSSAASDRSMGQGGAHDLDTGELTRYTNEDDDRSREV